MKQTKDKSLQELELVDNFLFGEVMSDEETCKITLEIMLHREIGGLFNINKEQHLDVDNIHKSIRMDIFFSDDKDTIYNVEMQTVNRYNIPKRSRYYQSVIDIKILPAGEKDYGRLNDSVVIFICTFDLFGRGRFCYTFENRCIEEPDLALGDGVRKLFLNTRGTVTEGVSPELIEFLHYLENSKKFPPVTERVKKISERVKKVKKNAKVEERYMTLEDYLAERLESMYEEVREDWREEVRMEVREEVREEVRTEVREEVREEVRTEVREEGAARKLIEQVCKKIKKGKERACIADELEEPVRYIEEICRIAKKHEPEYTSEAVYEDWKTEKINKND